MKYSILIPTYKVKYLKECIDSVLSQTVSDFEVIIVNDASPENIREIIDLYDDSRIKYYTNQKCCGALNVVDNWNISLSYAEGDFVICMGDDDCLAEDCLEQYDLLMTQYPDLDLYHGMVKIIDENSEFIKLQESRPAYESAYSMIWHKMNGRIQYIGDYLYRRSELIRNGGFYKQPLAWGTDNISAYIAAARRGVANTYKPIFHYRSHQNTITKSGNYITKIKAIKTEKEWIKNFIITNPPQNEMDNYYIKMISERIDPYYLKQKLYLVAHDMCDNGIIRLFYWLHCDESCSIPQILFALTESVKMKNKRR
ncbi:MAG: glycosyltransferase family 2 protein [Rikenellaceae bacterium]